MDKFFDGSYSEKMQAHDKAIARMVYKKRILKTTIALNNAEELLQIGWIASYQARLTFDPARGVKFGSYAQKCVFNAMVFYLKTENKYAKDLSLDDILAEDEGGEVTRHDVFGSYLGSPDAHHVWDMLLKRFDGVFRNLKPTHQRIIRQRICNNRTHREIAQSVNLSERRIGQVLQSFQDKIAA